MVLDFSQGKLIATEFEVQIRLSVANVVLQASAEDVSLRLDPPMIIANGGSVRWSMKLDNSDQLQSLQALLGIDYL
ncbi:DUF3389 domain-containing protein [Shewanella oneidensis MR-1]|uniref:DUF3389 domain-containing protein n=1 Tax=Shewanella oneidensis (strain ATCC 700550 / JCM 31522 / CIP 106686 / LMG 19005 / NCIMB 14063 / MR-1) TaxID=211586 RepID=Q8EFH4_SHEON|nr:DUF3389 domain-containing protein [Shewanella oneidensis]AAN55049.1 protein of unknown function DUF3389 [Shewanella oneidensis MR-1]MDX5996249.1 DUF3389 domain-containing protein [Shewanella oneidensis]MEE2029368.1 hypothetical protein [Shewanella oneidensis]QKG96632.1 DUF3389 domain-containing protein [Shewanella oneidensis MR-1]